MQSLARDEIVVLEISVSRSGRSILDMIGVYYPTVGKMFEESRCTGRKVPQLKKEGKEEEGRLS